MTLTQKPAVQKSAVQKPAAPPAQKPLVGLAAALREQTKSAHEQAENSPFVADLLAGKLPIEAYTDLVAQNYAIYHALEDVGRHWHDDPVAGRFVFAELERVPSLEHDLAYLLGPQWRAEAAALVRPATALYVEHLHETCGDWAGGFIAHHYVRYLGDLSGGQVIRVAIARIYGQAGQRASSFYTFTGIEKIKPFRDSYRELLDHAPLGARERTMVVAEAVTAFDLNRAVFADLSDRVGPASGGGDAAG